MDLSRAGDAECTPCNLVTTLRNDVQKCSVSARGKRLDWNRSLAGITGFILLRGRDAQNDKPKKMLVIAWLARGLFFLPLTMRNDDIARPNRHETARGCCASRKAPNPARSTVRTLTSLA